MPVRGDSFSAGRIGGNSVAVACLFGYPRLVAVAEGVGYRDRGRLWGGRVLAEPTL